VTVVGAAMDATKSAVSLAGTGVDLSQVAAGTAVTFPVVARDSYGNPATLVGLIIIISPHDPRTDCISEFALYVTHDHV